MEVFLYMAFGFYQTFVTVDDQGKIIIGTYKDARNRKGWVSLGHLHPRQPEYELDDQGNVYRTLWGKKHILYTADQIRQAVELAKRKKERVPYILSLIFELNRRQNLEQK